VDDGRGRAHSGVGPRLAGRADGCGEHTSDTGTPTPPSATPRATKGPVSGLTSTKRLQPPGENRARWPDAFATATPSRSPRATVAYRRGLTRLPLRGQRRHHACRGAVDRALTGHLPWEQVPLERVRLDRIQLDHIFLSATGRVGPASRLTPPPRSSRLPTAGAPIGKRDHCDALIPVTATAAHDRDQAAAVSGRRRHPVHRHRRTP
jgi:hypothetical protein